MKLIIAICEGPHDLAFLYKILSHRFSMKDISGYKIPDFQRPLSEYLLASIRNFEYEQFNVFTRPLLPVILEINDDQNAADSTRILLYSAGGDTRWDNWKKIITDFIDIKYLPDLKEPIEVSACLFFDADKMGVEARAKQVIAAFSKLIPELENWDYNVSNIFNSVVFKNVGLFVFCHEDGYGNLENVILPLMRSSNEEIFDAAEEFIVKLKNENRPSAQKFRKHFDVSKSVIGVAGQLQYSGVANNSIIKQCDYITQEKIQTNEVCVTIYDFFKNIISAK